MLFPLGKAIKRRAPHFDSQQFRLTREKSLS